MYRDAEGPSPGLKKIAENQNDVSDEECEEVWCDKENEEDLELVQMQDKELSGVPRTLVAEMANVISDNRLQGELAMGYSSEHEDGEITGLRGQEKAYDSEGADRSDTERLKITLDKTVRKSQRVHTRSQKLN